MDTLSHGLYGGIAAGRKSKREYAIAFLFGIAPDVLVFVPYMLLSFLGVFTFERDVSGKPDPSHIPDFVYMGYDLTHSLVVYAFVAALLYATKRKWLLALSIGWPLHILVDIPTHSTEFFPTPFLWPLSDFVVNGVPWSQPYIFIPNVVLIIGLYTYWFLSSRNKKKLSQ
jgi:membrane-bound metal-dependent hydrolase YbcI (DUF457 family)